MKKLLFLLPLYLFAVGVDPECIISQKDFPLINGLIDPLSGSVHLRSVDHVIKGAEPIVFQKTYSTEGDNRHSGGGWEMFPDLFLYTRERRIGSTNYPTLAELYVKDINGRKQYFVYDKTENGKSLFTTVNREKNNFYRNTLEDEISGRVSPLTMSINMNWKRDAILNLADGTKKKYEFTRKIKPKKKSHPFNGREQLDKMINSNKEVEGYRYTPVKNKYRLTEVIKPNKNIVTYRYDKFDRLEAIVTMNPSKKKVYAETTLVYEDQKHGDKNKNFTLYANGKKIGKYHYWRPDKDLQFFHDNFFLQQYLEPFLGKDLIKQSFGYDKGDRKNKNVEIDKVHLDGKTTPVRYHRDRTRAPCVTNIIQNGTYYEIDYYKLKNILQMDLERIHIKETEDNRCDRVKYLYGPSKDKKTNPLYQFEYELGGMNCADKKKFVIKTHVKNLENYDLSIFHFNDEKIPTKMECKYNDGIGKKQHYSESYYWYEDKKFFKIASVLFRDEKDDNSSMTIKYLYDSNGNVEKKILSANLSGQCNKNCEGKCDESLISHIIKENKEPVEFYRPKKKSSNHEAELKCKHPGKCADRCNREEYYTKYRYSEDGFNLPLSKEEESGFAIKYDYLADSNLLKQKISYDKNTDSIFERQFFHYNDDNILIEKITDDGTSFSEDDSGNIKKITIIKPKEKAPALNLPEVVEEYYEENGQRILLQSKKYSYNDQAEIVKEETFGPNGEQLYSTTHEYAENGLLLSTTDPIGRVTTHTYDVNGDRINHRLKSLKDDSKRYEEEYSYDSTGNIKEKIQKAIGQTRVYTYDNNRLGHKVSETDFRGNTTKFTHDGRGNVVTTTLPSSKEDLISTKNHYDAFGNVILSIGAEGHKTYKKYNSYGSVTEITYPDSTTEKNIYYLNGLLKTHIDQEGIETKYTYDTLGRQLTKTISQNGNVLSSEESRYNGFSIIFHKDAEENEIHYFYDGAGRKIAEEFCHKDSGKTERTEFGYDVYGNLYSETVCNGPNTLTTITERDCLGRTIEERQEDLQGNLYNKITYKYDDFDNKELATKYIDGKEITTRYKYDEFNRLVSQEDEESNTYKTDYIDHFVNDSNQHVLQKISTDPLGVKTIETYNPLNQVTFLEKQSPSAKTLCLEEFVKDKRGNTINQKSTVFCDGASIRNVELHQKYDDMNRLETLIEAANTDQKKTTTYKYTKKGQLKTLTKPDGTILYRTYWPLGFEKTLYSSDNTIDYEYHYSNLGHLLSSKDLITQLETKRILDNRGRLLQETLSNGLQLSYEYDLAGRELKTTLFDGSTIKKEYSPAHLTKVTRKDSSNNITYTHNFVEYDLSGNLLKESFNNDEITYSFDHLGRITSLHSPYLTQIITKYDAKDKIEEMTIDNDTYSYQYDDLEQLISEKGRFDHDYLFDSHNNCLNKDGKENEVNHLNQVTQTADTEYSYDDNGNTTLKKDHQETTFIYDALDRLIRVEIEDQDPISYIYDSFHRRVIKKKDGKQILYLYQDQNEIGQVENNTLTKLRILGLTGSAELGASIAMEIDNTLYIPLHDLSLNVACLLSSDKDQVESYRYSAFGQEETTSTFDSLINPWRFSSKRKDTETGYIYFGRRYYDPELGRWTTKDPKGYEEGINLYAFVLNNPLTSHDLYGLELYEPYDLFAWDQQLTYKDYNNLASVSGNWLKSGFSNPRVQGCLQGFAGLAETGIGGGMTLGTGGSLGALGWPIMLHGLDHTITGFRTALTGQCEDTASSQGLQMAGVSQGTANRIDHGLNFFSSLAGMGFLRSSQSSLANYYHSSEPVSMIKNEISAYSKEVKRGASFAGSKRGPLGYAPYQKVRNESTVINGRGYVGHSLDRMQDRGIMPSVIENTIKSGISSPNKVSGRLQFYEQVNNISVITENGEIITVTHGRLK